MECGECTSLPNHKDLGGKDYGVSQVKTCCGIDAKVPTIPDRLAGRTQRGVATAEKRQTLCVALVCLK